MKNLVHCFSRKVVSEFLDSLEEKLPFELIAAVMLQRLYEEQWRAPTMIGFYMTAKYADLLEASDVPDQNLVMEALRYGRKENSEIDFVLVSEEGNSLARSAGSWVAPSRSSIAGRMVPSAMRSSRPSLSA